MFGFYILGFTLLAAAIIGMAWSYFSAPDMPEHT